MNFRRLSTEAIPHDLFRSNNFNSSALRSTALPNRPFLLCGLNIANNSLNKLSYISRAVMIKFLITKEET
ncbi:hypothetical protein RhiirA5_440008 [Rhizophagus irregularis]|uniref:Uncharacterized protein n=1 Tax=Rhizophagus irregularis TaxID=588596 RepID=A0A2N0NH63_9GLOM|nr:hypothetical protein RhiirA5_440008 [Rhizophagus irregularis]